MCGVTILIGIFVNIVAIKVVPLFEMGFFSGEMFLVALVFIQCSAIVRSMDFDGLVIIGVYKDLCPTTVFRAIVMTT